MTFLPGAKETQIFLQEVSVKGFLTMSDLKSEYIILGSPHFYPNKNNLTFNSHQILEN